MSVEITFVPKPGLTQSDLDMINPSSADDFAANADKFSSVIISYPDGNGGFIDMTHVNPSPADMAKLYREALSDVKSTSWVEAPGKKQTPSEQKHESKAAKKKAAQRARRA